MRPISGALLAGLLCGSAAAATLQVGPGKQFGRIAEAVASASPGDVIEVDPAGDHAGDVCRITAPRLTIRSAVKERVRLPSAGKIWGGKAIFVVAADDFTVEGIAFSGARAPEGNGAGLRLEGRNVVVRNCTFEDCEDGILGGAGDVVIERCEFVRCGLTPNPQVITHNLYLGQAVTRLTFRGNYSHASKVGHLLKCRARESLILSNRFSDEDGTGSYRIDLPNGGRAVVMGNVIEQGPRACNNRLVTYGGEGLEHAVNALWVVNNTMVNDLGKGTFVHVAGVPDGFTCVVKNNVMVGIGVPCNYVPAELGGNFQGDPRFVDRAMFDYRLAAGSPCIDKGVDAGRAGEFVLEPKFQYVFPTGWEARPSDGRIDIGAFEAPSGK